MDLNHRVLLKLATERDGAMVRPVLQQAGIEAVVCPGLPELAAQCSAGAGALVLAEEALGDPAFGALREHLLQQPPWSDIPLLLLARSGADSRAVQQAMDQLPNVTVIERPLRVAALVSALRSALRARRRQYELHGVLAGLQQADRRKDEFLATLAHELRNPLAPIANALELLRRRGLPADEPVHAMVRRQLTHLVRLIDDLMEVSRITRGRVELRPETLHIGLALADALDQARPLIDRAGHRLVVQPVPETAWVHGDRVRLAQVFCNLLANAAKYTPDGGRIELAARVDGAQVVVDVADNGAGIEPGMLEAIFDMFVQARGATRAAQGGLGIGLTLARSLIELHHGRLHARSPGPKQGATFTVALPRVAGLRTPAPPAGNIAAAAHAAAGPAT